MSITLHRPEHEARVRERVGSLGPLEACRQLIAENDDLIRTSRLDHGRDITMARTAIYTALAADWAAEQQRKRGYDKPFAVVALGGTGRGEVTPCSDLDFAYLFEGRVQDDFANDAFFLELQRQTLHTREFEEHHGFILNASPCGLDDAPGLTGKDLNSFLDMHALHDPSGLADRMRQRIVESYDAFEHFLYVRGFWKEQWEKGGDAAERLDQFDIKNDGLRIFLGGIWTLAAKEFRHSHDIYRGLTDPRDLEAYEFLLRIRSWIHLRRPHGGRPDAGGNHREDVLGFEDFVSFGDMLGPHAGDREQFEFANDVRSRLLSARRRLASFSRGIIERELHDGRRVEIGGTIIFGASGLYHAPLKGAATPHDRSRAALSLLLASQRYGVPVDPSEMQGTFRNAGDWLVRVPEVSELFQEERGSLATTFEFLSRLDDAVDRFFPGYARFETSLDERVMEERKTMRGVLEREKMRALEGLIAAGQERLKQAVSSSKRTGDEGVDVAMEATLLDVDHLTAVKLALKTKRLPVAPADMVAREDEGRPWPERFASGFSGIPLENYFAGWSESCGFSNHTLEITQFLIANRRAFKNHARVGMNSPEEVEDFGRLCGDEQRLRALYVFTCADRIHWESETSDPVRWWNTRELYSKALMTIRPGPPVDPTQTLRALGYEEQELVILRDFGSAFFSGMYRRHAARFGSHLLRIAAGRNGAAPKAALVRDGTATMLGVAARDWPGLAACISGSLWHQGLDLRQAHLFSAMHQGLALDFFHLHSGGRALPHDLATGVEQAIMEQRHISPEDEATIPAIHGTCTLTEIHPGECCLRSESDQDTRGTVYALCYKIFRHLGGNIHGLTAYSTRRRTVVSVYHKLPSARTFDQAREIVVGWG